MKDAQKIKQQIRMRRKQRARIKIAGSSNRPRLSVYRSLTNIYAQLIDDSTGRTLVSVSSLELDSKKGKKIDLSSQAGKLLAKKAEKAGISQVVFDRGSYKYHGRVKALADGAREGGLKF